MMVKNEENRIHDCLCDIFDLFSQILVFDTGSTDQTQQILQQSFGITPTPATLDSDQCYSFGHLRNQGLAQLTTPWILSLDADERIDRAELEAFVARPDDPAIAGYFCAWPHYEGDRLTFEDYKIPLFRRGIQRRGLVHDNVQRDIRAKGLQAEWLEGFTLHHYPEVKKSRHKSDFYLSRLFCAIQKEPEGVRYYWFIGYMFFLERQFEKAREYLAIAADSHSQLFPVECLNGKMVLAEIEAREGNQQAVVQVLVGALAFYEDVAMDFEVRVNVRLRPWLERSLHYAQTQQLDQIRAYRFAC